jgi:hypothetical protein
MTNLELEFLIESLNKKNTGELIFLKPLCGLVEYGKAFALKPNLSLAHYEPQKIYCIRNREGIYVAAVADGGTNLHWLVLKDYRRQGHLSAALQQIIMPHIFQHKREQRIIIDENLLDEGSFTASKKIAVKAGFVKTHDNEGVLTYQLQKPGGQVDKYFKEPGSTVISRERMIVLKKQLNFISQSLLLVQTEIEIKRGVSKYSEKLKDLSNDIYRNMDRMENVCCKDVPA